MNNIQKTYNETYKKYKKRIKIESQSKKTCENENPSEYTGGCEFQ